MKKPLTTRKKPGGIERLALKFRPESIDTETRTFEATVATQTPVRRFFGREILACNAGAVNVERLADLPLLDSHQIVGIDNLLGRAIAYRFEGPSLVMKFRLAETERGDAAMAQIAAGTISKMSVGYTVDDETESRATDGTLTVTVTRWTPFEASLVSVPADPNAKIRGMNMKRPRRVSNPPPLDLSQDDLVDDDATITDDEDDDQPPRQRQIERTARDQRDIDTVFRQGVAAGLDGRQLDADLRDVRTADEARTRVFHRLAENSRRTATNPGRKEGSFSRIEDAERHMVEALSIRLGGPQTIEGQNEFRGMTLVGMFRAHMELAGTSTRGMSDLQIVGHMLSPGQGQRAMHTTSDFPMLMNTAANDALMARFGAQLTPLKRFSAVRSARDFKPMSYIRPGEAPLLEKVNEAGEVKSGTLSEEKQGLQVATYGKMFSLSRQAIYNDSLGAFADFISAFGISAATTEANLFYELLSANDFGGKKLSDGKKLFHADHGNLGSAAGLDDITGLSAARQAMRQQMNVNGSWISGTVPAVLLVGPAQETAAEKIVATLNSTAIDAVNPFSGKLKVEVEDRYEGSGWWLLADPASRPAFMHAYLDGASGPQIETKAGWEVLGTEFRCILDFGCGVYDYRAAYFNPGE
ncbi:MULTISPECIES: prohead protease/major capsid protein fusion protein [unclassified Mesorhizobium]|uniref:prohead protease/major capsid protein fusion protein n=1 Tax=unclassified Mesorhizobium TaxID=325217 RepID=UPI00143FA7B2|nr:MULTISPECIES: prohead protease/major capsid protein fusion protein [unclassified Mesorhizobium]